MATFLVPDDLKAIEPNIDDETASAMIGDAEALAILKAPALGDSLAPEVFDAAQALLRSAVLRRYSGGSTSDVTGTTDTLNTTWQPWRESILTRYEINELRSLVGADSGRAFSTDTLPTEVRSWEVG